MRISSGKAEPSGPQGERGHCLLGGLEHSVLHPRATATATGHRPWPTDVPSQLLCVCSCSHMRVTHKQVNSRCLWLEV